MVIFQELSYPYDIELENFIRALSFQLNAEQKFNSLALTHKMKKGLINRVKSTIKRV